MEKVKVVILAAGKGTRMGGVRPKVLFKVRGRPMLSHVLDLARALRPQEIVVVVGFGAQEVMARFRRRRVKWVLQREQLGTGHGVHCACRALGDFRGNLLVLYGDMPCLAIATLKRLVRNHVRQSCEMTVLTAVVQKPKGMGRIVRDPEGRIVRMVEEVDASRAEAKIREVNLGAYCFRNPPLCDALARLRRNNRQGEYYLTDVVELFARRGRTVCALQVADALEAFGVSAPQDLEKATRILSRRKFRRSR